MPHSLVFHRSHPIAWRYMTHVRTSCISRIDCDQLEPCHFNPFSGGASLCSQRVEGEGKITIRNNAMTLQFIAVLDQILICPLLLMPDVVALKIAKSTIFLSITNLSADVPINETSQFWPMSGLRKPIEHGLSGCRPSRHHSQGPVFSYRSD